MNINMLSRVPPPVWITIAIIAGLILLAFITYSMGLWEPDLNA